MRSSLVRCASALVGVLVAANLGLITFMLAMQWLQPDAEGALALAMLAGAPAILGFEIGWLQGEKRTA